MYLRKHLFFFFLLGFVSYIIWKMIYPFLGSIALAAIIATVFYPYYIRILKVTPKQNKSIAAFMAVVIFISTIFIPLLILCYVLFLQAGAYYETLNKNSIAIGYQDSIDLAEKTISNLLPGYKINFSEYLNQSAGWLVSNIGMIFRATATTFLLTFIMLIALFYMLKDGSEFIAKIKKLSPLLDFQNEYILKKVGMSVKSVVFGTLVIALIQGVLTTVGLLIFGVSQPVLWGAIAAVCSLIPYFGTSIVFTVVIVDALIANSYGFALGLFLWGFLIVGLVDNFLKPFLISMESDSHPFAIFITVLGGIYFFGPMGFLVGPVFWSLFEGLLDLYKISLAKKLEI
jgi:predicted PurR-regulated permease PerM